jgi:hypothetical protein
MMDQKTGFTHPVRGRNIRFGIRGMLGEMMEAVQIEERKFYRLLIETARPFIELVRASIVQQNTDRGRQDHFHFFGRESGLF